MAGSPAPSTVPDTQQMLPPNSWSNYINIYTEKGVTIEAGEVWRDQEHRHIIEFRIHLKNTG